MKLKKSRLSFKSVAATLALCLLLQDLGFAAGSFAPSPVSLSNDLGSIQERSEFADSDKLIINIQDAHAQLGAQESIANILDDLVKRYDLKLISLEGASDYVDTRLVSSFPDAEVRRKTAEALLKQGRISAGEFYSMVSEKRVALYGAEDRTLYEENLGAFRRLAENRPAVKAELLRLRSVVASLEKVFYSNELKNFLGAKRRFRGSAKGFSEFWRQCRRLSDSLGIRYQDYPNLTQLNDVLELENGIDFKKASREREVLMMELSCLLPKKSMDDLILLAVDYKKEKVSDVRFHRSLLGMARGLSLSLRDYPDLDRYMGYLERYERIEFLGLLEELERFESDILKGLQATPQSRGLAALSERARLLTALLDVNLESTDYEKFLSLDGKTPLETLRRELEELCRVSGKRSFTAVDYGVLEESLPHALRFYEYAAKRNQALMANTLRRMEKENVQVAALITGGFHSGGLARLLNEEKVSHLVVMPKFDDKAGERPYITILTQKPREYEAMFKSSDAYITAPVLFDTAAGERMTNRSEHKLALVRILSEDFIKNGHGPLTRDRYLRYLRSYRNESISLSSKMQRIFTPEQVADMLRSVNIREVLDPATKARTGLKVTLYENKGLLRPYEVYEIGLGNKEAVGIQAIKTGKTWNPMALFSIVQGGLFILILLAMLKVTLVPTVILPLYLMMANLQGLWGRSFLAVACGVVAVFEFDDPSVGDKPYTLQDFVSGPINSFIKKYGTTMGRGVVESGVAVMFEDPKTQERYFDLAKHVKKKRRPPLPKLLQEMDRMMAANLSKDGRRLYKKMRTLIGHLRYGTNRAMPSKKEAHPHRAAPARRTKVWIKTAQGYRLRTENVQTVLVHNGDMDAIRSSKQIDEFESFEIFGREHSYDTIRLWQMKVRHLRDLRRGDSPVASQVVDFFTTKEESYASVMLAYQLAVADDISDAFGGIDPDRMTDEFVNKKPSVRDIRKYENSTEERFDEDSWRKSLWNKHLIGLPSTAPSPEELTKWADVMDEAFAAHLRQRAGKPIDPRLFAREFLLAVQKNPQMGSWAHGKQALFAQEAVQRFLHNDLYRAGKIFSRAAEGSFGVVVGNTRNPDNPILISKDQSLTAGFMPVQTKRGLVWQTLVGSERAAVTKALRENPLGGRRLNFDLIQGGVVAQLNPDKNSPISGIYSIAEDRELKKQEIRERWVDPEKSPYVSKPAPKGGTRGDFQGLAHGLQGIHDESDFNPLTFENLGDKLDEIAAIYELARNARHNQEQELDILWADPKNVHINAQGKIQIDENERAMIRARRGKRYKEEFIKPATMVFYGTQKSRDIGERAAKALQLLLPSYRILFKEADELLEGLHTVAFSPHTVFVGVSASGETSPTNQVARLVEGLLEKGEIMDHFVLTGEIDTVMASIIGQSDAVNAPFTKRIMTGIGRRETEAGIAAMHGMEQTVRELVSYLAKRFHGQKKDGSSQTQLGIPGHRLQLLDEQNRFLIHDAVPAITRWNAKKGLTEGKSPERKDIEFLTRKFVAHIQEPAFAMGITLGVLLFTLGVLHAGPVTWALVNIFHLTAGWTVSGTIAALVDVAFYYSLFWTIPRAIRTASHFLKNGLKRTVSARTGGRAIVIADPDPAVARMIGDAIGVMAAQAHGYNGFSIYTGTPTALMHDRRWPRVAGTLVFVNRPDPQLSDFQKNKISATGNFRGQLGTQTMSPGRGTGAEFTGIGFDRSIRDGSFHNTILLNPPDVPDDLEDNTADLIELLYRAPIRMLALQKLFYDVTSETSRFPFQEYNNEESFASTRVATTRSNNVVGDRLKRWLMNEFYSPMGPDGQTNVYRLREAPERGESPAKKTSASGARFSKKMNFFRAGLFSVLAMVFVGLASPAFAKTTAWSVNPASHEITLRVGKGDTLSRMDERVEASQGRHFESDRQLLQDSLDILSAHGIEDPRTLQPGQLITFDNVTDVPGLAEEFGGLPVVESVGSDGVWLTNPYGGNVWEIYMRILAAEGGNPDDLETMWQQRLEQFKQDNPGVDPDKIYKDTRYFFRTSSPEAFAGSLGWNETAPPPAPPVVVPDEAAPPAEPPQPDAAQAIPPAAQEALPQAPVITDVHYEADDHVIHTDWNAPDNVRQYDYNLRLEPVLDEPQYTMRSTEYDIPVPVFSLSGSTTYSITVQACYADNKCSEWSAPVTVTVGPSAPYSPPSLSGNPAPALSAPAATGPPPAVLFFPISLPEWSWMVGAGFLAAVLGGALVWGFTIIAKRFGSASRREKNRAEEGSDGSKKQASDPDLLKNIWAGFDGPPPTERPEPRNRLNLPLLGFKVTSDNIKNFPRPILDHLGEEKAGVLAGDVGGVVLLNPDGFSVIPLDRIGEYDLTLSIAEVQDENPDLFEDLSTMSGMERLITGIDEDLIGIRRKEMALAGTEGARLSVAQEFMEGRLRKLLTEPVIYDLRNRFTLEQPPSAAAREELSRRILAAAEAITAIHPSVDTDTLFEIFQLINSESAGDNYGLIEAVDALRGIALLMQVELRPEADQTQAILHEFTRRLDLAEVMNPIPQMISSANRNSASEPLAANGSRLAEPALLLAASPLKQLDIEETALGRVMVGVILQKESPEETLDQTEFERRLRELLADENENGRVRFLFTEIEPRSSLPDLTLNAWKLAGVRLILDRSSIENGSGDLRVELLRRLNELKLEDFERTASVLQKLTGTDDMRPLSGQERSILQKFLAALPELEKVDVSERILNASTGRVSKVLARTLAESAAGRTSNALRFAFTEEPLFHAASTEFVSVHDGADTILVRQKAFLKDANGTAWKEGMGQLDEMAHGQFNHVFWATDGELEIMAKSDRGAAIKTLVERYPETAAFENRVVFASEASTTSELQQNMLEQGLLEGNLVVVTDEPGQIIQDLTDQKTFVVSLAKNAANTNGLLYTSAKVAQNPAIQIKGLRAVDRGRGVFSYLPPVAPLYQKLIEALTRMKQTLQAA